jgi:UDP:flavonoid glycosyltransferase YjiC (YdhE family)
MLAYPRNHDQFGNAVRIEYHGIGLRGSREADTPDVIRSKAFQILGDPRFRERLRALNAVASRREKGLLSDALDAIGAEAYPLVRELSRPAGRAFKVS